MRRLMVNTLALTLLLADVGIGLGQQQGGAPTKKPRAVEEEEIPKPKKKAVRVEEEEAVKTIVSPANAPAKSKLEEMLAAALKNNPDIRVAAAKVAEAEAELNRTRLQVTQKVVALYYAIDTQKTIVAHEEAKVQEFARGNATPKEVFEARHALALAKAKLAELEAQLPALVGKTARADDTSDAEAVRRRALEWLKRHQDDRDDLTVANALYREALKLSKVQGPQADKIRKALQTPVKVDYKGAKLSEVFKDLEKKAPGLSLLGVRGGAIENIEVDMQFKDALPVSAILQALADDFHLSFVVRDYGILATTEKAVPPGAMTVEEFLRQKPADAPRGPGAKLRNPPAENVEGLVKRVEESSGLLTLTIGSDAGLAKGHTLELFRLNPSAPSQSKYLGTIRILEVKPSEAVAQPVGRLATPPQVGDRVASRILGN